MIWLLGAEQTSPRLCRNISPGGGGCLFRAVEIWARLRHGLRFIQDAVLRPASLTPLRRSVASPRKSAMRSSAGAPFVPEKAPAKPWSRRPGGDPAYSRREVPAASSLCGRTRGAHIGTERDKYPAGDPAYSRGEVQAAYSLCGLQPARHTSVPRAAESARRATAPANKIVTGAVFG